MRNLCLAAVLLVLVTTGAMAGGPPDYAYLLVQGALSEPRSGIPAEGLAVRLSGERGTFTTVTDGRGTFTFDRVPVGDYDLDIVTADGKVMRRLFEGATLSPNRSRARVRFGSGRAQSIRLEPEDERVLLTIPEPSTRWGRMGRQSLVFVGAALGLLAF